MNATIFSQVVDVRLALFTNSDYLVSVDNLARTSVRAVFGSISLDEAFSQRERIGTLLQTQMEEATDKWGVRINRVEVLEITPPDQILQAMALQKQADQEKRARILESEGQQQSAVNVADGQRQAAIKEAEGAQQSQILRAEGSTPGPDPRSRGPGPSHRPGVRGDQGPDARPDAGGDPPARHAVQVRREREHEARSSRPRVRRCSERPRPSSSVYGGRAGYAGDLAGCGPRTLRRGLVRRVRPRAWCRRSSSR